MQAVLPSHKATQYLLGLEEVERACYYFTWSATLHSAALHLHLVSSAKVEHLKAAKRPKRWMKTQLLTACGGRLRSDS